LDAFANYFYKISLLPICLDEEISAFIKQDLNPHGLVEIDSRTGTGLGETDMVELVRMIAKKGLIGDNKPLLRTGP
jgi:hypothetical protein